MKKKVCFVFSLMLFASVCRAATVQWNVVGIYDVQGSLWQDVYGCDHVLGVSADHFIEQIAGYKTVNPSSSSVVLSGQNGATLASNAHAWRQLNYGDLVDATSVMGDFNDYFFALFDGHYNDVFSNLVINRGESVYLGFFIENHTLDPLFGWVELGYDGKNVFVVNSAMETTGLGIYAGTGQVVPEPSTALLALVGISALCLRRRRVA